MQADHKLHHLAVGRSSHHRIPEAAAIAETVPYGSGAPGASSQGHLVPLVVDHCCCHTHLTVSRILFFATMNALVCGIIGHASPQTLSFYTTMQSACSHPPVHFKLPCAKLEPTMCTIQPSQPHSQPQLTATIRARQIDLLVVLDRVRAKHLCSFILLSNVNVNSAEDQLMPAPGLPGWAILVQPGLQCMKSVPHARRRVTPPGPAQKCENKTHENLSEMLRTPTTAPSPQIPPIPRLLYSVHVHVQVHGELHKRA